MSTTATETEDLTAYRTEALLDSIIQLTHRITCGAGARCGDCDALRAQRTLASAEVLRRAGA